LPFISKKLEHSSVNATSPLSLPLPLIVSFFNQKGGVGKTTHLFHFASFLSLEQKKKVLCLDMDPQGNLSSLWQQNKYENQKGFLTLMMEALPEINKMGNKNIPWERYVYSFFSSKNVENNILDCLESDPNLTSFELMVASLQFPKQLVLKNFLEKNKSFFSNYDIILIDCPPTLGLLSLNALLASQYIIVPFRPDPFSYQGIVALEESLELLRSMKVFNVPTVLGAIPNLVSLRRKQEKLMLDKITFLLQNYYPEILIAKSLPNVSWASPLESLKGKDLLKIKEWRENTYHPFLEKIDCDLNNRIKELSN